MIRSHSKIEKLYMHVLSVVELIPSMWDYCYIMSVDLTGPGRINLVANFKTLWALKLFLYVDMATIVQYRFINHQYFYI